MTRPADPSCEFPPGKPWRAFLDAVDGAIFLHDAGTGQVLDVNQAACDLYGYTREEFCGLRVGDLSSGVHPYTQDEALSWVNRAAIEGPQRFEWYARHCRGQLFWVEVSLRCAPFPGGPRVVASVRDISERKRADAALRESEEHFQSAFRNAVVGMGICRFDGRFLQANQALCALLGYEEEELLERTFLDVTHPEDRGMTLEHAQRLERGECASYQLEKRYLTKSEKVVWVAISVTGIRNERGQIIRALCQVSDITERRRAIDELRHSERRYRYLVETMNDGLVVRNPQNRIVYANERFGEMLGISPEELVGRHLDELHDDENRRKYREHAARRAGGVREAYNLTWLAANGRSVETRMAACPLFGEDGTYHGSFAVVTDLTAQREAEARLRETQERFRKMTSATRDMVHLADRQGRLVFVNPAIERLLGYAAEDLLGQPVATLIHPEDWARVLAFSKAVREGEEAPPIEVRLLTQNGEVLEVEGVGFRVDASGGDYFLGSILRDLSRRRAVERERAALERELSRNQALEAVGRLAGGVAHDFNNLLGSVLGCVYMARLAAGEQGGVAEELARVESLCKRGGELTSQLLTVARRQAGRVDYLEVRPLIEEMKGLLSHTLPKHIRLEVSVTADLPQVRAERSLLTTGLLNLALNARDAMPQGGTLRLCAGRNRDAKEGDWVDLSVTDSGTGIPEEVQDLIFQPFFTTKEVGDGNGLGLATTRAAVQAWGGEVRVETDQGKGSTFTIRLPAAGHARPEGPPESPAGNVAHPLTRSPVLVVEDEEDVARLMVRALEGVGYVVTRVSAGLDALEELRQRKGDFGLVVLDLILPEWGGDGLYRVLRSLVPEVPILLVSGREDLAETLTPEGPALAKPFTAAEFVASVSDVLGADS